MTPNSERHRLWIWGRRGAGLGVLAVWPEAPQAHLKRAFRRAEFDFGDLALAYGDFMSEGRILQREAGKRVCTVAEPPLLGVPFRRHG